MIFFDGMPKSPDLTSKGEVEKRRDVANELESAFIAEVLSVVGVSEVSKEFGGGVGEEQFKSFLHNRYADMIVQKGGIGLAESFLKSLGGENER